MTRDRIGGIPVSGTDRSRHVSVIYPFFGKATYKGVAGTRRIHGVNDRGLNDFASIRMGPHRTTRAQGHNDIRDACPPTVHQWPCQHHRGYPPAFLL